MSIRNFYPRKTMAGFTKIDLYILRQLSNSGSLEPNGPILGLFGVKIVETHGLHVKSMSLSSWKEAYW